MSRELSRAVRSFNLPASRVQGIFLADFHDVGILLQSAVDHAEQRGMVIRMLDDQAFSRETSPHSVEEMQRQLRAFQLNLFDLLLLFRRQLALDHLSNRVS